MKLRGAQEAGSVTIEGVQQEAKTFKIAGNLKAFRVLSDGLYSDKIRSIIRELCCNAQDSHVAANKLSEPFIVHFPNQIEPFFSVRDFGVGLSESDVYDLYTTYFSSSKDDSNDFIGALGLGSKSPFSYVENFSVTSWHNGTKSIYSAFVDESGIPSVQLMTKEPTNEGNGLEVQFPVRTSDLSEFHSKGAACLEFFAPVPKHNLWNNYSIPKNSYFISGTVDHQFWGVRNHSYTSGVRAIMGPVAYQVDLAKIGLSSTGMIIADMGIDIHFAMGDIEVAASREKLSFTDRTKKAICDRYDAIAKSFVEDVEKLEECKNPWEGYSASSTNSSRVTRLPTSRARCIPMGASRRPTPTSL